MSWELVDAVVPWCWIFEWGNLEDVDFDVVAAFVAVVDCCASFASDSDIAASFFEMHNCRLTSWVN